MIALYGFAYEWPSTQRCLRALRAIKRQEPESRKTRRGRSLVKEGLLGTIECSFYSLRELRHDLGERIQTLPARLRLGQFQGSNQILRHLRNESRVRTRDSCELVSRFLPLPTVATSKEEDEFVTSLNLIDKVV